MTDLFRAMTTSWRTPNPVGGPLPHFRMAAIDIGPLLDGTASSAPDRAIWHKWSRDADGETVAIIEYENGQMDVVPIYVVKFE